MSFAALATIACLGTIAAGIAATHPLELREHRWWKIAGSLPLVVVIAATFYELEGIRGYFAMWSIGLLGFIWKGCIAHFFMTGIVRLVHGNPNQPSGIRAEFAGAKTLFQHGDLPEALELTLGELEKEPMSYEGLMFLAEIHDAMGQANAAAAAWDKLLRKPGLSAAQRAHAAGRRDKAAERRVVAALNRR